MSILTDLNPQAILAKVAVVGVVAAGAFFWGHHVGYSGEKSAYDLYVANQKSAAESQLVANKSALAFQQTNFQLQMSQLQKGNSDEVESLTKQRDAAKLDSGKYAGQLRQYLSRSHAGPVVSGSGSGTGQPDQAGAGGLSDGVSSLNWYLTQRFYDADVNAAALNEAIAVIAKDRELCNGSLPGVTAK